MAKNTIKQLSNWLVLYLPGIYNSTTYYDLSWNWYNWTWSNITNTRTLQNNVMGFNGSSGNIIVSDAAWLRLQTLTISAWVKQNWTSTSDSVIIRKDTVWTRHLWDIYIAPNWNNIAWRVYNWTFYTSTSYTLTTSAWTHVAMTISWSGWTLKFYINWTQVWSNLTVWAFSAPTSEIAIWSFVPSVETLKYFNWNMSNVRLYNRVLTSTEINQIRNAEYIK